MDVVTVTHETDLRESQNSVYFKIIEEILVIDFIHCSFYCAENSEKSFQCDLFRMVLTT